VEARPPSEAAARLGADIDDALDDIGVPAAIVDRQGVVLWMNDRMIEVAGNHRGKSFLNIFAPDAEPLSRREFAKLMLGTARTSDRESVMRSKDGEHVPVEIHAVALDNGNQIVGLFGVAHPRGTTSRPRDSNLTPRQREVLGLLAKGHSTVQIAEALSVTRETVRNHVRAILAALDVHSRLEAVAEARSRGLVD
jgi:PAS domain S-box-containing protein